MASAKKSHPCARGFCAIQADFTYSTLPGYGTPPRVVHFAKRKSEGWFWKSHVPGFIPCGKASPRRTYMWLFRIYLSSPLLSRPAPRVIQKIVLSHDLCGVGTFLISGCIYLLIGQKIKRKFLTSDENAILTIFKKNTSMGLFQPFRVLGFLRFITTSPSWPLGIIISAIYFKNTKNTQSGGTPR